MRRRRFKQMQSLEQEAKRLRDEAKLLPPGAARDEAFRKARQAEMVFRVNKWPTSPGLQPPK
jgi:hypothetical protein